MKRAIRKPDPWLPAITGTALIAIVIEIILLQEGVTQVYPHLFYIPIILAGYRFQRSGILIGCGLAAVYLLLHIIIFPDTIALAEAFLRFLVMAGVGIISGTFSWKLTESKQIYQTLFDDALNPVLIADEDGTYLEANKAALDFLNRSRDEVIGKSVWDFVPPECLGQEREAQNPFTSQRTRETPFLVDGEVKTLLLNVVPVRAGGKTTLYGIGLDITGQKKAEKIQKRLASIVESSGDAITSLDLNARVITWNRGAEEILGWKAREIIGRQYSLVIPLEDQPIFIDYFNEMIATKTPQVREVNRQHRSGRKLRMSATISPILDQNGTIIAISGILRDITREKEMEERLRKNEAILRIAGKTVQFGGYSVSLADSRITWSDEVAHIHDEEPGYSPTIDEGISYYAPKWQERIRDVFSACAKDGIPYDEEMEIITGRETRKWVRTTGEAIRDESGEIIGVQGACQDITEQKVADDRLQRTFFYTRGLIEASLDPLVTISPDGLITDVNKATETVTGISREDLIGSDFATYFTDPKKAQEGYREAFRSGFVRDYALTIKNISGETRDVLYNASIYCDQSETVQGVFAAARDITREKEMMQKIQENLYEKETLLREIHHRVKNNMQVVSSLLHLQALTIGDERFMGAFQDSENRIASMALVHEHLYQSGNLARINAAEYVRKLSLEIAHSYSSSGKITMTHRLDDLTLDIDTATYCGLIVNELLSNAMKHAFKGRGEGRIGISLEKDEEGSIILTFEDDGIGMPETIDLQTGSTLGVELIRTFVRQIKGSYSCSPRPGGGTRWQIWFRNRGDTGPVGLRSLTEDDTNPLPPSSA
ncbi:MAG: PAS domain S-box protein [Methanocalculus sp. MSAO_Arc1]|uniref:PAS domain S-box protein n=1 Tax=Methanocalculus TaxID=71151 RepID=UPI000FF6CDA9|nr:MULTISPECIES: PAS domain S-box protein [unclassified Methanocalculus]MCP1661436.1 PAS domain S-box-containing protein [Methanocalculus sp. AMF5]RQD80395.1 MAG: PAS domain S-box protein [Methanocalculus sp. MSAO_Arc1]